MPRFGNKRQWQDAPASEAPSIYELDVDTPDGAASMLMGEWHTVCDGRPALAVMTYDTGARAAQLLGEALAHLHR